MVRARVTARARLIGAAAVTVVTILTLAGCTLAGSDRDGGPGRDTAQGSPTPTVPVDPTSTPVPADCPVTQPNPVPTSQPWRASLFGSESAFGNGLLWVGGLGPAGVITVDARSLLPDGSIGWKLGWWREVPGKLVIAGRRLDAPGPPLRGEASDGYGDRGFQASGVYFPSPGCWEVTGTVGQVSLTFVTFVAPPRP
jgi:hypothetical protein